MGANPTTLGEALAPAKTERPQRSSLVYRVANAALLTVFFVAVFMWAVNDPASNAGGAIVILLILMLWMIGAILWSEKARGRKRVGKLHFLLAGDQQGFMARLKRDAKTVVFDGNNVYHFGLANEIGPQVIRLIAQQLRSEGYRVVCIFDATIFFTMIEYGNFSDGPRHTVDVLMRVFGLHADEIYVVPSGTDADKYVLSTLKHLPKSFAVSNDQYRDYGKIYGEVMKGDQWRKGVFVTGNEIRLKGFKFKKPVRLSGVQVR